MNFNLPKDLANIYWITADIFEQMEDHEIYGINYALDYAAQQQIKRPLTGLERYKLLYPLTEFTLCLDMLDLTRRTSNMDKICILRSTAERLMGIPVPRFRMFRSDKPGSSRIMNSEGLTFHEWSRIAVSMNRKAWEDGEDPTEYRNETHRIVEEKRKLNREQS